MKPSASHVLGENATPPQPQPGTVDLETPQPSLEADLRGSQGLVVEFLQGSVFMSPPHLCTFPLFKNSENHSLVKPVVSVARGTPGEAGCDQLHRRAEEDLLWRPGEEERDQQQQQKRASRETLAGRRGQRNWVEGRTQHEGRCTWEPPYFHVGAGPGMERCPMTLLVLLFWHSEGQEAGSRHRMMLREVEVERTKPGLVQTAGSLDVRVRGWPLLVLLARGSHLRFLKLTGILF